MPIYDYKCNDCGEDFMRILITKEAIDKRDEARCPNCESENTERQISRGQSFIVKGEGAGKPDKMQ